LPIARRNAAIHAHATALLARPVLFMEQSRSSSASRGD
jgi:hypothetical protein